MSKGIQKPSSHDLINDLQAIWEIKERLHEIDIIRLKELVIQLDKMLYDKFRFINDFLILNPSYSLEDRKMNTWQYGFNYNMLEKLKDLIQNRIELLTSTGKKEGLEEFYPFYDVEVYKKVRTYLQLNVIEPYKDISYLYQRLKKDYMHYTKQIDFIDWLLKKELITTSIHKDFTEKGQLYAIKKVETGERKNKFDNHFNLN